MTDVAMELSVLKTVRSLRKETPRRFKDLKNLCEELEDKLTPFEKSGSGVEMTSCGDFGKYLMPFVLAIDTRQPRLVEIALQGIHHMIEKEFVKGSGGGDSGSGDRSQSLIDFVIELVAKCGEEADEGVQLQVIKCLLTAITMQRSEVHGTALLQSVKACFWINLMSKNQDIKTTTKAALTQIINVVNQRMEIEARAQQATAISSAPSELPETIASSKPFGKSASTAESKTPTSVSTPAEDGIDRGFPSVAHEDAYFLFRALCRLSVKGTDSDAGEDGVSDATTLQNKILSLELLLSLLQNIGPAARSWDRFVHVIRKHLCVSLLNNCTSYIATVTGLSLQLFIVLIGGFKEHLKQELEVFVSTIFFRILESENSTHEHKVKVLEVFQGLCRDPKGMVELFINYDCDLEATNLFSRIASAFARIAKNPPASPSRMAAVDFITNSSRKSANEELTIRTMALDGLALILRSLITSSAPPGAAPTSPEQLSSAGGSLVTGSGGEESESGVEGELNSASPAAGASESAESVSTNTASNGAPGSSDVAHVSTSSLSSIVETFDRKLKLQEELVTGIYKFSLSPMKGLRYLASMGHLEMEPRSVAQFLLTHADKLDKTQVGELLGRERDYENGFAFHVLHEYAEALDFSDMKFDVAIRHFLQGFRLPGEAQKIDRIMEKFAERYYVQHREEFASADLAFILAFSVIMLQTNLHNPAIKEEKRMTREQFLRQNKGISTDGELSDELLTELYDRIAAEPITLNSDKPTGGAGSANGVTAGTPATPFVVFQSATERKKKDAFMSEQREMVRAGRAMIQQQKRRNSVFLVRDLSAGEDLAYVKPMIEAIWPAILGVLSQLLETSDEPRVIDICIRILQDAITLACQFDFATARQAYILTLCKFTALDQVRELKPKHVASLRLLLDVALTQGEYLEDSWTPVLQSVSQLARLLMVSHGGHGDDLCDPIGGSSSRRGANTGRQDSRMLHSTSSGGGTSTTTSSLLGEPLSKLFMGVSRAESLRQMEEMNAELLGREIDPVLLDRIFLRSTQLSPTAVLHFVRCLCDVSLQEISAQSSMHSLMSGSTTGGEVSFAPRTFSLQKMVEVADYNMSSRARVDWSHIWRLLADHFSAVGLNDHPALSMFAIDSLKQLSIKFLAKDELAHFNFQRVFLKPFEVIMARSHTSASRDLVLRCVDILVQACAPNIRSGWRSIFAILSSAATQDESEAKEAFSILERLLTQHFALLAQDFVELQNCLVAFASCRHTELCLRALAHLVQCASHLANGGATTHVSGSGLPPLPLVSGTSDEVSTVSVTEDGSTTPLGNENRVSQVSEDDSVFRLWWPLLLGLATRVADPREAVRQRALDTLHGVLQAHGAVFSPQTWAVIFKGVLFPMIDSARLDDLHIRPIPANITGRARLLEQHRLVTEATSGKRRWIETMGLRVLEICLELYERFKEKDRTVPLLPDLLSMLESCVTQDMEILASMALGSIRSLLERIGSIVPSESVEESTVTELLNRADGLRVLETGHVDLVVQKLYHTVYGNLCFDFADAGRASLSIYPVSKAISDEVDSMSFAQRRRINEPTKIALQVFSTGQVVDTPVGRGVVRENVISYGDIPERIAIRLDHGATLFTFEDALLESNPKLRTTVPASPQASIETETTNDEFWVRFSLSIITSMAVTRQLIDVISEFTHQYRNSLALRHHEKILTALEAMHWHAYSFNENLPLRLRLNSRGVAMNTSSGGIPDLLSQEIAALKSIIDLIASLYLTARQPDLKNLKQISDSHPELMFRNFSAEQATSFAGPWLERIFTLVLSRYVALEESLADSLSEAQSDSSDEEDVAPVAKLSAGAHVGEAVRSVVVDIEFSRTRHVAYREAVLLALRIVGEMTPAEFHSNRAWLVPLITRLILCGDQMIRVRVAQLHTQFIHPILLA